VIRAILAEYSVTSRSAKSRAFGRADEMSE
jgi:hypothetical protein